MKPDKRGFTEPDYDFSKVVSKSSSESELQACYFYEYARESRAARSEIAAVRKQRTHRKGKPGRVNFGPRVQNMLQSHAIMWLSLSSGFPNTPWQRLSDEDKLPISKMIASQPYTLRYALTWQNPPLSLLTEDNIRRPYFLAAAKVNEPGTMTLDMWKQWFRKCHPKLTEKEPIKFGFFALNLKYGHCVLIDEFKGALRTLEGKPKIEFPPVAMKPVK